MPDNLNPSTLIYTGFALVPGLLVLYVRAQFLAGHAAKLVEGILPYFIVTIAYWSVITTIFGSSDFRAFWTEDLQRISLFIILFVLVVPALIGLLAGIEIRLGFVRWILQISGLNPLHPITYAWDWKFNNIDPQFLLVTLKDGTKFAGFITGNDSLASSDPNHRDLCIGQLYAIPDSEDEDWQIAQGRSAWIAGAEIQSIEFINTTV